MSELQQVQLPEGWEVKKLEDLFDVKSSRRVHKADWKDNGVPFYRAREVVKLARDGRVDNDLFISEELYQEFITTKGAPKEGDIIISAVGTLGQCYLVQLNDKFYFKDASVLWFEKRTDVNPRYIEYSFKSDCVMKQVMNKSMGATVGTLTISRARNIEIAVPPLETQKQIVAVLDEAFAAIDLAKANIEKNLQNAKELFQSKLNQIFTQKGDGWEEKKLGEIVNIKTGKLNANAMVEGGEYPFFTCSRDIFSIDIYAFDCEAILLAGNNASGDFNVKHYKGKFNAYQRTYVITSKEKGVIHYSYLKHKLISHLKSLKEQSLGANTKFLKVGMIRDITLPLPSYSIQEEIVQQLDGLYKQIKQIEVQYQQKLDDLHELKKSILQEAFSGELS